MSDLWNDDDEEDIMLAKVAENAEQQLWGDSSDDDLLLSQAAARVEDEQVTRKAVSVKNTDKRQISNMYPCHQLPGKPAATITKEVTPQVHQYFYSVCSKSNSLPVMHSVSSPFHHRGARVSASSLINTGKKNSNKSIESLQTSDSSLGCKFKRKLSTQLSASQSDTKLPRTDDADRIHKLEEQLDEMKKLLKLKEEKEANIKRKLEEEQSKRESQARVLKEIKKKDEWIVSDLVKKNKDGDVKDSNKEKGVEEVSLQDQLKAQKESLQQVEEMFNTELQCGICTELFVQATSLNCSHAFCALCISQWMKTKKDCPMCRTKITSHTRSLVLDTYIDKMSEHFGEEMKENRRKLVEQRKKEQVKLDEILQNDASMSLDHLGNNGENAASRYEISLPEDSFHIYNVSEGDSSDGLSSDSDSDINSVSNIHSDSDQVSDVDDDETVDIPGDPSVYYGGHGRCFRCGCGGHWARGCPFRH